MFRSTSRLMAATSTARRSPAHGRWRRRRANTRYRRRVAPLRTAPVPQPRGKRSRPGRARWLAVWHARCGSVSPGQPEWCCHSRAAALRLTFQQPGDLGRPTTHPHQFFEHSAPGFLDAAALGHQPLDVDRYVQARPRLAERDDGGAGGVLVNQPPAPGFLELLRFQQSNLVSGAVAGGALLHGQAPAVDELGDGTELERDGLAQREYLVEPPLERSTFPL